MSTASCDSIIAGAMAFLTSDDDPRFWEVAIRCICRDAELLCDAAEPSATIFVEIGACSHWRSPHQHRWLADGGFAAPFGYGGTGFNIHATPNHDWSIRFLWSVEHAVWQPVDRFAGKRRRVLRIAMPTRTRQHKQAAVHTTWTPRPPAGKDRVTQLYGFRCQQETWQCTATRSANALYDKVAEPE
jgi:hypothetical protein